VPAWFSAFAEAHLLLAAVVYVLFKAIAVVVSPVPGLLLDLPAISIFGWGPAFVLAEIGIMIGAMTAFAIGRLFRERAIARFAFLRKVREWEMTLPPSERFVSWVVLRLPNSPAFDYISYAAGLTDCSPTLFFWSTLIGNVPFILTFFVLAGVGSSFGPWATWVMPLSFVGVVTVLSMRYAKAMRKRG